MFYLNISITGCADTDPNSPEQLAVRAVIEKLRKPLEELLAFNQKAGYYIQVSEDGLVDARHRRAQNVEEQTAEDFLIEEGKTLQGCDCEYCERRRVILRDWQRGVISARAAVDHMMRISVEQAAKEMPPLPSQIQTEEDVAWDEKTDSDTWRKAAKDMGLDGCV